MSHDKFAARGLAWFCGKHIELARSLRERPLLSLPQTVAETSNKGHGRLEKRCLTLMVDEEQFLNWPGVCQVFKLERFVAQLRTGRESNEIVYGITSCPPEKASAAQLLQWTRAYWGIENGLHYRRDVTLHEDTTRISHPALAKAMANGCH